MPAIRVKRFHAEILERHKGAAVIVPFDPADAWKAKPSPVPAPYKTAYLVKGTLNDVAFEGFISKRWGRNFIPWTTGFRSARRQRSAMSWL